MAVAEMTDKDIIFEKRKFYVARALSDLGLGSTSVESMTIREQDTFMFGSLTQQLAIDILTRKLAEDSYVSTQYHPASWWQMLKRDHLPKWFVKRYPVENRAHKRTVKFTRYANYPKADIAIPKEAAIRMRVMEPVLRDEIEEYGGGHDA